MMKSNTILVVDDEEFIRDLVKDFLELKNIPCDEAATASAAIDLLQQNQYGLVLVDLNLEDSGSEELIAEIKRRESSMPVLILTGDQRCSREDAVNMGADGVIYKPFQIDSFLKTIQTLMEPE